MSLAVPKETRHRTKQEFVYHTLREAIMRCTLAPGARLVIDELARQLEVSAIPVREALQLLQSEGLVVNVPHVGATVAHVSRESILEVFTVMEGLEMAGARIAVQRATSQALDAIGEIVAGMDRAMEADRYEEWADLNTRFHLALTELAGLPLLQEMMERVFDRWERVRRFFFNGVLLHRVEQAQEEHHLLLAALVSRDRNRFERAIREHNQNALASYTAFLERQAE